jgi:hypothetical protein
MNKMKKRIMIDMMLTDRDPLILSQLDTKFIVEQIRDTGAEVVIIWFKDENGFSYYPTKYGKIHPNLKCYDFSGEMVKMLKESDIKVIAYYIVGMDLNYANTHHDEQIVFSDNRAGTFPLPCINTHYRQYVLNQLVEIVENYDVDGIWLDCIFYPQKDFFPDPDSPDFKKTGAISCFCPACLRKFQIETNLNVNPKDFIRGSDYWVKWVQYRQKTLDSFLQETCLLLKSIKPEIKLSHNLMSFEQHDWRGALSWRTEQYDDWLSAEAYYEWSGHLHTSLLPKLLYAAGKGKPFEVIVLSHSRLWDWTLKPTSQLLAESVTAVAHGGAIVIDDHLSPFGKVEPQMYLKIKNIFEYIKELEDYFYDLESIKYAAVVYSEKTRDFYFSKYHVDYQSSFDGTCRALIEQKIPFDIVMDENITAENLRDYKVIVLSNIACMNDEIANIIDIAVKNGSGIVATYETSLYYDNAKRRNDFALNSLGVHYLGNLDYPHIFLQFTPDDRKEILKKIPVNIPLNVNKPYIKVSAIGYGIGQIRFPMIWACNHHYHYNENPPGDLLPYPAIWVNSVSGGGVAVFFPCDIGGTYAEFTIPEAKHLLINAILFAGGEPPLILEGPLSVEAVYRFQKTRNRFLIHLINFPSAPLRTAKIGGRIASVQVVEEIPEVHHLTLFLGEDIRQNIYKVVSMKYGDLDWQPGSIKVTIPTLHIHDVIMLELK